MSIVWIAFYEQVFISTCDLLDLYRFK